MKARYMSFDIQNYENETMMMLEVGNVMAALVRNGYQCLFRYEDCGIYILEYAEGNREYGAYRFMYVSPEEEEDVYFRRENPSASIDDLADTCDACQIDTPTGK